MRIIGCAALVGVALLGACGSPPVGPEKAEVVGPPAVRILETRKLGTYLALVADVPSGADAGALVGLTKEACGNEAICTAGVWTDAAVAPRAFPLTDPEVEAQVMAFNINRNTGYERAIWDCERFPHSGPEACGL